MPLSEYVHPVSTVPLDAPVAEAARTMRDARVGCLVAMREGRPVGVLTDRDLTLRVLGERRDPRTTRVADVVTFDPIVLGESDSVDTAVLRMREHGIRRLPIVDAGGKLVGIVTMDDLLVRLGRQLATMCDAIDEPSDASESR